MKYIGISFKRELSRGIDIHLYGIMLSIILWAPRLRRPTYYYYNNIEYTYSMEAELIKPKWFIGLVI